MKMEQSSAEFELNSLVSHSLFGIPKARLIPTVWGTISGLTMEIPSGTKEAWDRVSMKLESGDISKLSMWPEYREEICSLYNPDSTCLLKDVNSAYWVSIGGTGWGAMWSVGLGSLESGKYPR